VPSSCIAVFPKPTSKHAHMYFVWSVSVHPTV